ncbi:MAG: hypothetical protein U9N36_07190 [Euryarchaeota archaeon]|nr:hypothetical protein [Euryarchaeota archaeon]
MPPNQGSGIALLKVSEVISGIVAPSTIAPSTAVPNSRNATSNCAAGYATSWSPEIIDAPSPGPLPHRHAEQARYLA